MKRKTLLLMMLLTLGFSSASWAQQSLSITSPSDWYTFASNPSAYSTVDLYLDITVTEDHMAGTESDRFSGTFDGHGNKLTVSINGNSSQQGVAPFRYISDATIKNLKVEGSVTAYAHHGGGLVGFAYSGTNTIENCLVSTDVTNNNSGTNNNYIGGIVGHGRSSTVKIIGCVYNGTLTSSGYVGGLLGWSDNINYHVINSLFDGTVQGNSNRFNPFGFKNGNIISTATFINCYSTIASTYSDSSSTNMTFYKSGSINSNLTLYGVASKVCYSIAGASGSNVTVALTGTTEYEYNVSQITGYSIYESSSSTNSGIVYDGTVYAGYSDNLSLLLGYTGNQVLDSYSTSGGTLSGSAITGTNDSYTLAMPSSLSSGITISATTSAPTYVLHDSDNNYMTWAEFAQNVLNGGGSAYSGKTVYLDYDVTVTEPIGIQNAASGNGDHFFAGTFDGQGHTITLDMTATRTMYGLFAVLSGTTVQNLIIDGSISNSNYEQIGGLAGYTLGTCTINNCVSNVSITSTYSNDKCGGFIGEMGGDSKVTFNGCAFTGTMDCKTYCAGFVGYFYYMSWNGCTLTFNDCLFTSTTSSTGASSKAPFFCSNASSYNSSRFAIKNSYYTFSYGSTTNQGKRGYTVTGETGVTVTLNNPTTDHTVSQIQGYGSTANKGLSYNGTIIAGSGDAVSLNLSYANAGSGTVNYNATYGSSTATLAGNANPYTLTMPAANTTINVSGFNKTITAYNNSERGNYYLIASPVGTVTPSSNNGFLSDTYNLYYFDQNGMDDDVLNEWRNYSSSPFNIESGKGYLYASKNGTTLTFTGTPYGGNGQVTLSKTEGVRFSGWNLVGNPFPKTAYIGNRAFYIINPDGRAEIIPATTGSAIEPMEGIFVIAGEDGETLTFSTEEQAVQPSAMVALNVYNAAVRGNASVIDRAIVNFTEGQELPKFQLDPNHTKLYIPQGDKDYAVVHSQALGELPVNFKAEDNGQYTLSVELTDVEMDYLHLIDNMTGTDVDLLAGASTGSATYTFYARTTDYASRFKLVFSATGIEENGASTGSETFAYYNGSEWNINNAGNATLQVVDMTGRVLSSETINGNCTKAINAAQGIYVLRLVNGDNVKVQKVVVR